MNSSLILDKSQPELAKLVAGWKDGGEYTLEVKVRQVASDDAATTLRVLEVMSDDAPEEESEPVKKPKTMSSGYSSSPPSSTPGSASSPTPGGMSMEE
jgi:hypothetical protein